MNFLDFFNYRIEFDGIDKTSIKKRWHLTNEFKEFLEDDQNSDYLNGVFSGIINVISDGELNFDCVKKYDKFRKKPLRGLRKVHVSLPNLKSLGMNVCRDISMSNKNNILTDNVLILNKYSQDGEVSLKESILLHRFQEIEVKKWKTGFWLIYGISNEDVYFLYLDLSLSHDPENDQILFNNLLEVYSESYLAENFLE